MGFYPSEAAVPQRLQTELMVLRPLRATDVELDYAAVMSSPAMLRQWSLSGWPSDEFTLAENLEDLVRHEREHEERTAFTFTVLTPDQTRCLGCVYLSPPWPLELRAHAEAAHPARASFWVRGSEIARDLDRHLLAALRDWLETEWAFDSITFTVSQKNERQAELLREAGLGLQGVFHSPDGRGPWLIFC